MGNKGLGWQAQQSTVRREDLRQGLGGPVLQDVGEVQEGRKDFSHHPVRRVSSFFSLLVSIYHPGTQEHHSEFYVLSFDSTNCKLSFTRLFLIINSCWQEIRNRDQSGTEQENTKPVWSPQSYIPCSE